MRNVYELRGGDLLIYDTGAICVVFSTDNYHYGLFYADQGRVFMANTPQDFYHEVAMPYVTVIRT